MVALVIVTTALVAVANPRARGYKWLMLLCILSLIACFGVSTYYGVTHSHQQHQIQEDDPGWDCHTMGNRICGPGR